MISLNIIICRNHVHATFKENLKYCHLKFSKIDPILMLLSGGHTKTLFIPYHSNEQYLQYLTCGMHIHVRF